MVRTTTSDWQSTAGAIAQIVVAFAAIVGFFGIFFQVRAARNNAISDRTGVLQRQWGSLKQLRELGRVIAFMDLGDDKPQDECIDMIRAWCRLRHGEVTGLPRTPPDGGSQASKLDVIHVLLFYEELCQRYNAGELDRKLVASSIGPELLARFKNAAWFIHWRRAAERDDHLYEEWETALRRMRRRRRLRFTGSWHWVYQYLREESGALEIRAICVPPEPKVATESTWKAAKRLSEALALDTALPHNVIPAGKPPKVSSSGARKWTVVLIPRTLDDPTRGRGWDKAYAVAIEEWLAAKPDDTRAIEQAITNLEAGESVVDALERFSAPERADTVWEAIMRREREHPTSVTGSSAGYLVPASPGQ